MVCNLFSCKNVEYFMLINILKKKNFDLLVDLIYLIIWPYLFSCLGASSFVLSDITTMTN